MLIIVKHNIKQQTNSGKISVFLLHYPVYDFQKYQKNFFRTSQYFRNFRLLCCAVLRRVIKNLANLGPAYLIPSGWIKINAYDLSRNYCQFSLLILMSCLDQVWATPGPRAKSGPRDVPIRPAAYFQTCMQSGP